MGELRLTRDGVLLATVQVVREAPPANTPVATVSTAAQLGAAAANPAYRADAANPDRWVEVRGGSYGNLDWAAGFGQTHPVGTKVVLRARAGERPIVGDLKVNACKGLRFEDFQIRSVHNDQSAAQRLEFVRGYSTGSGGTVFGINDNASDWLIERWNFDRLTGNTSYGVYISGGVPKSGIKIRYCTFEGSGMAADAMELGNLRDFEIVGNFVHNINWNGAESQDPHADSLMLWASCLRGVVKDNRFQGYPGRCNGLLFANVEDTLIENNLVAHVDNWGWQNGYSKRNTFRHNTVYDCGQDYNGGGYGGDYCIGIDQSSSTGNVLEENLFGSCSAIGVASATRNLIQRGSLPGSTNQSGFVPAFADQVDWQPTNLPAGYEQVGYRPAPCGHLAVL